MSTRSVRLDGIFNVVDVLKNSLFLDKDVFEKNSKLAVDCVAKLYHYGVAAISDTCSTFYIVISLINLITDVVIHSSDVNYDSLREMLSQMKNNGDMPEDFDSYVYNYVSHDIDYSKYMPNNRYALRVMSLFRFCYYYNNEYSLTFTLSDRNRMWDKLINKELLPMNIPAFSSGSNGCAWVTCDRLLENPGDAYSCKLLQEGTALYDMLGLLWGSNDDWEVDSEGRKYARAVAIYYPVSELVDNLRDCRVPTASNAWGSVLWAPRYSGHRDPWPKGRGRTVNPQTWRRALPEAVHMPHTHEISPSRVYALPAGVVTCGGRSSFLDSSGGLLLEKIRRRFNYSVAIANKRRGEGRLGV